MKVTEDAATVKPLGTNDTADWCAAVCRLAPASTACALPAQGLAVCRMAAILEHEQLASHVAVNGDCDAAILP